MNKQIKQSIVSKQTNKKTKHWEKAFYIGGVSALVVAVLALFTAVTLAQSSLKELQGGDELTVVCDGRGLQVDRITRADINFFCIPFAEQPPVEPTAAPPQPTPVPTEAPPVVPPEAGSYYVATNGNDSNPGSIDKPLRSIQKAVNMARPGDVIYVRGGTYSESIVIRNSGTVDKPIVLAAYPGEKPVIDGQYNLPAVPNSGWARCNDTVSPPTCFHHNPLVYVRADNFIVDGFEITRSLGRGFTVYQTASDPAQNVVIRNNNIHDNRSAGIIMVNANNVLFESNQVSHSGNFATHDRSASEMNWPIAVNALDSSNITYRNNKIFENWTEGISTGRNSKNIIIENNEIYDNRALQVYIHRSQNVSVNGNKVYCTNNQNFYRGGTVSPGIVVNNESNFDGMLIVDNAKIVNNLVVGCRLGFAMWGGGGSAKIGSRNVTVSHNTFVNMFTVSDSKEAIAINIVDAGHRNIRIENNIIYQQKFTIANVPSSSQIVMENNFWSRTPPVSASGAGDIVGDPMLANPGAALRAGQVNADWYKLMPGSPAINSSSTSGAVTTDFFGNIRDGRADIGFHEAAN